MPWGILDLTPSTHTVTIHSCHCGNCSNPCGANPFDFQQSPNPAIRRAMPSLLFLCHDNASRSLMAEAFARAEAPDLKIASAGIAPHSAHPMAIRVLGEVGLDIPGTGPTGLEDIAPAAFDVVITLCRETAEHCRALPGMPIVVAWDLANPAAIEGDDSFVLDAFRQTRDEIRRLVRDLFQHGYLGALFAARLCESLILDNISDGIIAHDMDRHIIEFNRAAEEDHRIPPRATSSDETVTMSFAGNFCGGKCSFCDDVDATISTCLHKDLSLPEGRRATPGQLTLRIHAAREGTYR